LDRSDPGRASIIVLGLARLYKLDYFQKEVLTLRVGMHLNMQPLF
jgi:hypothetical protein